jgi:hypothetical protein
MKNKVKAPKGFEFVRREVERTKWHPVDARNGPLVRTVTTTDVFLHKESGVEINRELWAIFNRDNKLSSQYVRWLCPQLASGNAGLSYWIALANAQPKHRHDKNGCGGSHKNLY